MEKSNIDELTLTWDTEHAGNDSEVAKDNIILEGLHPHHNLKSLHITGFGGVMISGWVYSFTTNLLDISIYGCKRLQNLPPLHLLSHLKSLRLRNLPCLEWIDKDDSDDSSSPFFPSLEHLDLWELPNLRGWWRCSEEGMRGGCCHQFKSLDELSINNCPNLIFMPLHSSVRCVTLKKVSEKILQLAINHSTTLKLEYLDISEINDLKSLSGVLQHLIALRDLHNCEELDPCNDQDGSYGMQWKQLQNLRHLGLSRIPKMESVPDGLQHVTTLRYLRIDYCANLTNLPEWIASLGQSLQFLTIDDCPKLTSLPEGMRRLTSLQTLRIFRCPQLDERCRKEVGEDWPKISHVPEFMTNWD